MENVLTTGGGTLTADAPSNSNRSIYLRGATTTPLVIGASTTFSIYALKFYGTSQTQNLPAYSYGCYIHTSGSGTTLEQQGDITCNGLYIHGDGVLTNVVTYNSNNYTITLNGAGNLEVGINTGSSVSAKTANMGTSTIDAAGTIRIFKGGTLTTTTGTITAGGDWNNINGTFNEGTGWVIFDENNAGKTITNANTETFYNLKINKTSTGKDMTLNNSIIVTNQLNLTQGDFVLGSNDLNLQTGATTTGTPGANSYVQADGTGVLRKYWTGTGTFTYEVGDVDEYTKFTLAFTSGTFSSADVAIRLVDAMEPSVTSTVYISRYWVVTPTGITSPVYDVTYYYSTDASDVTGADEAGIVAAKFSGGTELDFGSVNTSTNVLSGTGLTAFSNFTGLKPTGLPIELTSFNAVYQNQEVVLSWQTASEINNHYFTVEKSNDAEEFHELMTVNGQGNSTTTHSYSIKDLHPLSGRTYYRLKQTDFDGHFTYSQLRWADAVEAVSFAITPNPVTNGIININCNCKLDDTVIKLFDLKGKEIKMNTQQKENLQLIPDDGLNDGLYMLLINYKGKVYCQKIIASNL